MKYSFESKVRFSEIGEDGHMTLNSILNYYQDSSNFHSEEAGLGIRRLTEKKRVWILSSWQICVDRYPMMGEPMWSVPGPMISKGFTGTVISRCTPAGENFSPTPILCGSI